MHLSNPTNRPSPFSSEDCSEDFTTESLIDLIQITERKPSDTDRELFPFPFLTLIFLSAILQTENILRCNIWTRGCQSEVDPATMSTTLVQAFTYALVDYVTEYKLLPTLYNNPRQNSFEPPPSPRLINTVKLSDETNKEFSFAQTRPFTLDNTIPTTPTTHSRRVSLAEANEVFFSSSRAKRSVRSPQ